MKLNVGKIIKLKTFEIIGCIWYVYESVSGNIHKSVVAVE